MQGGGGASRTFQSIFGSSGGSDRSVDGKPTETSTGATSELLDRIRTIQQSQRHESDEDAWGEDDEDGLPVVDADHNQTNSAGHARSIADWADHDDDEDGWKDALQSRVDQLELVVERAGPDSQTATTALHSSNCPPVATAMSVDGPTEYVAPVDQRATLTLVPKTTLARSISDPITANESKPATSKLKAPTAVTGGPRPGSGVRTTSTAASKGVDTSGKPTDTVEPRKRSNSRDYLTRQPLAADHKSTASNKAASGSNTNLVRAVVARGNVNVRNQEAKPSIDEHMDKRTRADDHNSVLSLSDAETARRYILSDVKKMSVERIVADAKRLHYLEELYRRHPAVTDGHDTSRDTTRSDGTRQTPSTKKRAI